jgi:hypothetical protein
MKELMIISYAATTLILVVAVGFVVWWPLAVYIWHYWFG